MRVKPAKYAKLLIECLEKGQKPTDIAQDFWKMLLKSGQTKDLLKILDQLDVEYAAANNKIIAKVYSAEQLSESDISLIKASLQKNQKSEIILKNIIKPSQIAGVDIKIGDEDIDLSIGGKLDRLKKAIAK